jgi:hypothetical protein
MIWRIGGVPEHFNFPWRSLEAIQFLKSQGLHFSWRDYPGGTGAMIQDLLEDQLDLAIVLTEGFIAAAAAGKPVRAICPFVESSLQWGVFVQHGRELNKSARPRFAVSRLGSGSHLMALYWARAQRWQAEDCEFVICNGLAGAKAALAEGRADYFLWEKYMTWPLVLSKTFDCLDEVLAPWMSFVVVTRIDFLAGHSTELANWKACLPGFCQMALGSLDARAQISERYGIPETMVLEWLSALRYWDGRDNWREGIAKAADIMCDYGMVQPMKHSADWI